MSVSYVVPGAADLTQADVREIAFQQLLGQVDVDKHGGFIMGISAVYLGGFDHCQVFFVQQMAPALDQQVNFSVQRIKDFQLLMPVQGMIAAGSGDKSYERPHRA